MRLGIRHRTTYRYEQPVGYSIQSLRLSPCEFDSQRIIDWRIDAPGIEQAASFVDGFGNRVHLITIDTVHTEIAIEVSGEIETTDSSGLVVGLREWAPRSLFLRSTPLTQADANIVQLAEEARGDDQVAQLHELLRLIRERVDYHVGRTQSETTAAQALAEGAGVCQDHTHIFIAAARALDIPARYVSGYLWATDDQTQEAQHAWAEAYLESLGWVGFDVSNGISPDCHYVRIACGLDYAAAAPVRGSRRGGGEERLEVHVDVGEAQIEAQTQTQAQQ